MRSYRSHIMPHIFFTRGWAISHNVIIMYRSVQYTILQTGRAYNMDLSSKFKPLYVISLQTNSATKPLYVISLQKILLPSHCMLYHYKQIPQRYFIQSLSEHNQVNTDLKRVEIRGIMVELRSECKSKYN